MSHNRDGGLGIRVVTRLYRPFLPAPVPDLEDVVFLQPGPVKMHPRVLRAMSRPVLHHRTPEFKDEMTRLANGLKQVFQTKSDVVVLAGSGTAGMEAAVAGLVGKGDRVVAVDNGKFGERLGQIGSLHGECAVVKAPWGEAVAVDAVAAALEEAPTKALAFVYNETSTGVVNPGHELCKVAKKHGAFVIMDAITALGSVDVPVDAWGVDVCITGSQKCMAGPTGLALVSVSARAEAALRKWSLYLDLGKHLKKIREGDSPYTPAVPLVLGMREAVDITLEEGLPARFARTRRLANATRASAEALKLPLYAKAGARSDTVTAIGYPAGMADADKRIRNRLKDVHRVHVAGGQDATKGKGFRIGHMGNVTPGEIVAYVHALEECLAAAGHGFQHGAGVAAASDALQR